MAVLGLKQMRIEAGLKQFELSRTTGIDQMRISRLERGLYTPTPDEIEKFIQVFSRIHKKANYLRILRAMSGLSQLEVAKKTRIHPLKISLAEREQIELEPGEIRRISRVLIKTL